jgi:hypothetical protein
MCDIFRARLHRCAGCTGGLGCPWDRPVPTSSAGARRLRKSKARSRREARRVVRLDTRDTIND